MSKVLIIARADGGASVVHPTPEHVAKHGGDETAALEAIRSKVVPNDATSSEIVEHTALPDRTFRNAWKKSASAVIVDMPQARVIHMDRIRIVRDAKLAEEDKNWNKAADQAAKDVVETRRVTLRDIPNASTTRTAVDSANDAATLDAVWPVAELGARE